MDYFTIKLSKFTAKYQETGMIRIKDGFSGERAFVFPPAYIHELEQHPLSAILHITDIGYYPHASHHYRRRDEPIQQYVFIYCVNGRGWYELNGQRHEVMPDSYFMLPPGEAHSYGADESDPWTIYWIHFKGSLAKEFVPPHDGPIAIRPGIRSRIRERISLFEEIMSTLEGGYSRESLLYACSVFHHFLGSLRYMVQYRDASDKSDKEADMVQMSIKFMSENIEKTLKLNDIASHIGYSPSHYSSIFSATTGQSPISYFIQLKIKRACYLLDFTNLKINQICHLVGLEDPYYFSRIFTKTMGVSPRAYRAVKKG